MLATIKLTSVIRNAPKLYKNKRCFSTDRVCKEIKIPTQWGDVAGKWWGPEDKRPILGIHGWQDNAGSFDKIAPYLPPHIGFLALDVLGHGLSPQIPPGVFYHSIDFTIFLRRIVQYFNWPKVSLLSHSLGAMNSFTYTLLYPESVDFLICLDGLFIFRKKHSQPDVMAETIDSFLKYDSLNSSKTSEPPSYTFSELEQMLYEGSRKSIDMNSCKYILRRNVKPSKTNPNKFVVTRDSRLKTGPLMQWTKESILEGAPRITCPIFLGMATQSPLFVFKQIYLDVLEVIKQQNKNVEYHEIEGTHHLHLNTPERIEGIVNNFIEKFYTE